MSRPSGKYHRKPPIGVMPSHIFYERRMIDLIEAIARALEWTQDLDNAPFERTFWSIEAWAQELTDISWIRGGKANG